MKYFTKESCYLGLQSGDPERADRARRKGQSNWLRYHKNLDKVLLGLPKRYRSFFKRNCQLGDGFVHKIVFSNIYFPIKKKNSIEIYVTHPSNCKLYVLRYKNVTRCVFDHPSEVPMDCERGLYTFGKWFTDELTMSKDGLFIHEILFDTGATLLIEFERFSYRTNKGD